MTRQSVESMRAALTELYGLSGSPVEQYFAFWGRLLRGDLGPSLGNFPTPVSEMIGQALPYTLSLLIPALIISWIFGNIFGAMSSYYPENKPLNVIEVLGQAVRPIPYYIVALVLLVVFGFFIPIFPFSGAYPIGTHPNLSLDFILTYIHHAVLPAATLVLVGFGGWFVGMKSLTSNIISEDYVVYAETAGLKKNKILTQYIMRTALLPQLTGLAMSLGTVFSGALIMEIVFGYPGIGSLTMVGSLQERLFDDHGHRHLFDHRGCQRRFPHGFTLPPIRPAGALPIGEELCSKLFAISSNMMAASVSPLFSWQPWW